MYRVQEALLLAYARADGIPRAPGDKVTTRTTIALLEASRPGKKPPTAREVRENLMRLFNVEPVNFKGEDACGKKSRKFSSKKKSSASNEAWPLQRRDAASVAHEADVVVALPHHDIALPSSAFKSGFVEAGGFLLAVPTDRNLHHSYIESVSVTRTRGATAVLVVTSQELLGA